MKLLLLAIAFAALQLSAAEKPVFTDGFRGKLQPGWKWLREDTNTWKITAEGLRIKIEPGNMWGPANDGKNVLIRPLPDDPEKTTVISVTVSNVPNHQYEQVDLVWYYDDSHQVKIGLEEVFKKLMIVMGREEKDRIRTLIEAPIDFHMVDLRLTRKGNNIKGEFRKHGTTEWRLAGQCDLPPSNGKKPRITLQCYQGSKDLDHWALIRDFSISVK